MDPPIKPTPTMPIPDSSNCAEVPVMMRVIVRRGFPGCQLWFQVRSHFCGNVFPVCGDFSSILKFLCEIWLE